MADSSSLEKINSYVCPYQMAFLLDNWIRRLLQSPQKVVGEYINPGDTVIDMGCGPGFFSIDMAKMVGTDGQVVAVDLQEPMLNRVRKKAIKQGVDKQMRFYQCGKDQIGLQLKADFILAYYMVHETPDQNKFFQEVKTLLKNGGRLLVVEPAMHVSKGSFEKMMVLAGEAGFKNLDFPLKKGGRSVLLG
jgi:ubiquinone/menaquinone biosynthesis C-methylase UbiE